MKNALLLGCSTIIHKTYLKGIDGFTQNEHQLGGGPFKAALGAEWEVTHVAAHEIVASLPRTLDGLLEYSAIVISDVGSNTFALSPTTISAHRDVDRLALIADYVGAGGGLVLVGGYFSFAGVNGTARFGSTPLAPILPVEIQPTDDRIEHPAGIVPRVVAASHPILAGVGSDWPALLGYNRTRLIEDEAAVLAVGPDPLLAVAEVGKGRVVTFMSDFAPHWASAEFLAWDGYARFWNNVVDWAAGGL
jgi:uncharacterized membrane protein